MSTIKLSSLLCILLFALGANAQPECIVDTSVAACQECNVVLSTTPLTHDAIQTACEALSISAEVCNSIKGNRAFAASALANSYSTSHVCASLEMCKPTTSAAEACTIGNVLLPVDTASLPNETKLKENTIPNGTLPVDSQQDVVDETMATNDAVDEDDAFADEDDDNDDDNDIVPPHHHHRHHHRHHHHGRHQHGHHGRRFGHGHRYLRHHHRARHDEGPVIYTATASTTPFPQKPLLRIEVQDEPGRPYHKKWHFDDGQRKVQGEVYSYHWSSNGKTPASTDSPDVKLAGAAHLLDDEPVFPSLLTPVRFPGFDDDEDVDFPPSPFFSLSTRMPSLPRLFSNFFRWSDDDDTSTSPSTDSKHTPVVDASTEAVPSPFSPLRSLFDLIHARMSPMLSSAPMRVHVAVPRLVSCTTQADRGSEAAHAPTDTTTSAHAGADTHANANDVQAAEESTAGYVPVSGDGTVGMRTTESTQTATVTEVAPTAEIANEISSGTAGAAVSEALAFAEISETTENTPKATTTTSEHIGNAMKRVWQGLKSYFV